MVATTVGVVSGWSEDRMITSSSTKTIMDMILFVDKITSYLFKELRPDIVSGILDLKEKTVYTEVPGDEKDKPGFSTKSYKSSFLALMKEGLFFRVAKEKEREEVVFERYCQEIRNSEAYRPWLGECSQVSVLETGLEGRKKNISIVSSPEAEAISGAGCFIPDPESNNLRFVLPRYHLGVPAQIDMEMAISQLVHTRIISEAINEIDSHNSGIIYFAREGHLTQMQKAVFLHSYKNLPTTLVSISHKPADNEYTRLAFFSAEPNLEGFGGELRTVFLCDPVASGMQHVAMIEKLEEMGRLPKKIVVIAPMATKFGLSVIERVCKEKEVEFVAGVAGVLLDTQPPLRYYSPYPVDVQQAADVDLHTLMSGLFGDKLGKSCIRCNWTGTFWGGMEMPLMDSDEELSQVGLSNEELLSICAQLSESEANDIDVLEKLLPLSTKILLRDRQKIR